MRPRMIKPTAYFSRQFQLGSPAPAPVPAAPADGFDPRMLRVQSGWLVKKGGVHQSFMHRRNWKKRWFTIKWQSRGSRDPMALVYFSGPEDQTPKGLMNLEAAELLVPSQKPGPHGFSFQLHLEDGRIMSLAAETVRRVSPLSTHGGARPCGGG